MCIRKKYKFMLAIEILKYSKFRLLCVAGRGEVMSTLCVTGHGDAVVATMIQDDTLKLSRLSVRLHLGVPYISYF